MKPWLQEPTQQTNKNCHVTHPSPALPWGEIFFLKKKFKWKNRKRTGSSLMRYWRFFDFLLPFEIPGLGRVRSGPLISDLFEIPKTHGLCGFVLGQECWAGVWTPHPVHACMPAQDSCP
jgi:hypothetical protein